MKTISISIPGSKSLSNRALVLAALNKGKTTLVNIADCDDTSFMISGLKKLGIKIKENKDYLEIEGCGGNFKKSKKTIEIYTGNAGTTTRFLAALATITGNEVVINGDERMRERPISELTKALTTLGADIKTTNGFVPLKISAKKLVGGLVKIPGNISSQYLSAILLVAACAKSDVKIRIEQELCSKPYLLMTLKLLKEFGIKFQNKNFEQIVIKPLNNQLRKSEKYQEAAKTARLEQKKYTIESDASSASYFGAYAALHPNKPILLKNIHKNSLQGDIKFLEYLKKMGCKISQKKDGTIVQGPKILKSLGTVDMNETPDIVMTFAILALFTEGKTKITNIGNLRIKETDRLQALENEINKLAKFANLNVKVKTGKDWIEIKNNESAQINRGNSVHKNPVESKTRLRQSSDNATISTYNDHRMAMSFGILTNIFPFIKIENPGCVSKSYMTFWDDLAKCIRLKPAKSNPTKLLQKPQNQDNHNIILTGLRGSGKSKIGKLLAEKLNKKYIDTDKEIEKLTKSTIPQIVKKHGWPYFRAKESQVTKKLAKVKNTIISTGGGLIIDPTNAKILQKTGKIIYLHVKPEICTKRILESKKRPPLTNKKSILQEMQHLYKERDLTYRKTANIIFDRSQSLERDIKKLLNL
ncbi:MAG: 3-phosphoshikimate 1-carboxyvinyltransferase [Patescibacteria group bacterium]